MPVVLWGTITGEEAHMPIEHQFGKPIVSIGLKPELTRSLDSSQDGPDLKSGTRVGEEVVACNLAA
jgi:hypothetical protein